LGARRIANQARGELIAAGAKPRRDAITGRDALTASELRVARLAAEDLTHREIAQALLITTKTAKAHLSRVYHKLAITRRSQLADALTGQLVGSGEDPRATAAISYPRHVGTCPQTGVKLLLKRSIGANRPRRGGPRVLINGGSSAPASEPPTAPPRCDARSLDLGSA
jgi:DNA-binding CsgD family transcriptional regulator